MHSVQTGREIYVAQGDLSLWLCGHQKPSCSRATSFSSLQQPEGFVGQGSRPCLQLFIFFFFIEELPDGVLESDDDEEEDDEVSWRLLTPHKKLGPNY